MSKTLFFLMKQIALFVQFGYKNNGYFGIKKQNKGKIFERNFLQLELCRNKLVF